MTTEAKWFTVSYDEVHCVVSSFSKEDILAKILLYVNYCISGEPQRIPGTQEIAFYRVVAVIANRFLGSTTEPITVDRLNLEDIKIVPTRLDSIYDL